VIIGAVGGSGTRVFARLVRMAGVFMGSALNYAEDSEPIMEFHSTWLRRYLESGGKLSGAEREAAEAEVRQRLVEHLAGHAETGRPWGVKVPRNILLLRFWDELFPVFRFIHVVRNGLDMAYSSDRNQLNMVGDLVLGQTERQQPLPLQAIAYWQRVNVAAADFGERHLGRRYLRVRFEDVCTSPERVCAELFEFVGATYGAGHATAASEEVDIPLTIGRWRDHPAAEVHELMAVGQVALRRFGYWDEAAWLELPVSGRAP
jgi:hypothetical protein